MRPVLVLILHLAASVDEGPLVRELSEARLALAERQRLAFLRAGADEARIVAGPPDSLSFGSGCESWSMGPPRGTFRVAW